MEKLIISAALTGAWPTKKNNPNIPTTPKEIAEDAYRCYNAGVSIVHLHMRDENEAGTMDKDLFAETVSRIREKCDVVINLTTSGELGASDQRRYEHLIEIKPELASYDCGSMNWMHAAVFLNSPAFLEKLGRVMIENNVKPEIECFDAGMVYNAMYYIQKGIILEPPHFQICLGAPGGMTAEIENLLFMQKLLPANATWSAFGIGAQQMPILYTTIALGGHVRVGMEDNIYYAKGVLADSNAQFVERAVRAGREFGREIATPADTRKMLSLL
ncbi:MAG: 3-keto-5-aminohexanoate cleavage protein [Bacillota bacterium]|nr:3-keto-5-aminohexanoate cleavage protein [Bacillota bacterium]MDW7682659.1 3-keto-5-aminohexanoate cleavage protein [Bacillota bacterium]